MRRILLPAFLTLLLLSGCAAPQTPDTSFFPETASPTPPPLQTALPQSKGASARAEGILQALRLCEEFSSALAEDYADLGFVPADLTPFYDQLDAAASEEDYLSLERSLSTEILRMRQGVFLRIDNISKLGDTPPESLQALLEEYERKFAAAGW